MSQLTIEEIKARMQERATRNNYMVHSHIELEDVGIDFAVFTLTIAEDNLNPNRTVHGGALYTMADCTAGCAVHTDGRKYVTQTSSFNFFRSAKAGETIRATSRVRRRGITTCYADVDITDSSGNLLCTGGFTYFCIGKNT